MPLITVANLKISESWERAYFIYQMKRDRPVDQGELAGQGEMYADARVIVNHQHNGGRAVTRSGCDFLRLLLTTSLNLISFMVR